MNIPNNTNVPSLAYKALNIKTKTNSKKKNKQNRDKLKKTTLQIYGKLCSTAHSLIED